MKCIDSPSTGHQESATYLAAPRLARQAGVATVAGSGIAL